jgi:hypothetical protein
MTAAIYAVVLRVTMTPKYTATAVAVVALALTGCASISPEERARAACAWVLWSATAGPPSLDPYRAIVFFPRAGYDTHDQCEDARARYEQMQEQMKEPELAGLYTCLPDTVDPRGPKGGAR